MKFWVFTTPNIFYIYIYIIGDEIIRYNKR